MVLFWCVFMHACSRESDVYFTVVTLLYLNQKFVAMATPGLATIMLIKNVKIN